MPSKPRPLLTPEEFEELVDSRDVDSLLEALSRFVKEPPGRKKVYDSDADRQRAYRASLAQQTGPGRRRGK